MGDIDLFNIKCELRDIIADLPDDTNRKDIYMLLFLYLLEKSYDTKENMDESLVDRFKNECIQKKNSWKIDIMSSIMKIDDTKLNTINDMAKELCQLCKRDEKLEELYNNFDLTDENMKNLINGIFD